MRAFNERRAHEGLEVVQVSAAEGVGLRELRSALARLLPTDEELGGRVTETSHEGKIAAEVAAGMKSFFDARAIPSVAYTDPEVAWLGLTETEAKEKGIAYEKGQFPWAASGRALGVGDVKFTGQVLPSASRVVYNIDIKRVIERKLVMGIADGKVSVDDRDIYFARDLRVGLFQQTDTF